MKTAVTVCLIPEAAAGPFVFHGDLATACRTAKEVGYDAVELFLPDGHDLKKLQVKKIVTDHGLAVSALGSGGGWILHKLTLTSADETIRTKAKDYIRRMMYAAAELDACVIIGSMQGRHEGDVTRPIAEGYLAEALHELEAEAATLGQVILYEPLNRYETNLITSIITTAQYLDSHKITHVKVLADLFHMNIEETNLAEAIRTVGPRLGHVHFADSNRHAMGFGHTDAAAVVQALRDVGYTGYLSAEVFPKPDSSAAAKQTMATFRQVMGVQS